VTKSHRISSGMFQWSHASWERVMISLFKLKS
jgi:hypothetical protein